MRQRRLLRWACAVLIAVCAASYAYRVTACAVRDSLPRQCISLEAAREPVLYGKGLVSLGGFELNATFTPDGKFYSFSIAARRPAKQPAA